MRIHPLALSLLATLASAPVLAAGSATLTVYRSDDAALFGNDGDALASGYAVVRESRRVTLAAGTQDLRLSGLPRYLDPEALALDFPGDSARVLSQRLVLARGDAARLASLIGQPVQVLGDAGNVLASGTLAAVGDRLEVRQGDSTVLVDRAAAVRARAPVGDGGAQLDLRVTAPRASTPDAELNYTTAGLGWRASYIGTLAPGGRCRLTLAARASIANRSGSDWRDADLTLIAGEPRLDKPGPNGPVMAMAYRAKAADSAMPEAAALADYRSYRLPARIDLPDGTVSLVPLLATRELACERSALYETGSGYQPPRPLTQPDMLPDGPAALTSTLQFRAADSLPAGTFRVLARDERGASQVIGESRLADTPQGSNVDLVLGNVFDLRGARERTAFHVDRDGRRMDEAFRLTFSNAGDTARTVTVREHPSRWREWTLASSSQRPTSTTPDTLVFRLEVPAHGKATLDYDVRYHWAADVQPQ